MSNSFPATMTGGIMGAARRAEGWLDDRGRFAWFLAIIAGFVLFWPVGLALLAYAIWSKRMFNRTDSARQWRGKRCGDHRSRSMTSVWQSSGNMAFDAYKADTLRRLEQEQQAFEAFLQRLRDAKDKSQFDSFMEERARGENDDAAEAGAAPTATDEGRAGTY